jgi:hypothetical protein
MRAFLPFLLSVVGVLCEETPLDAYLAAPDPAYNWVLNSTIRYSLS